MEEEYEVNKYLQKDVKPVQLASIPVSLRVADSRTSMEVEILKSLITSYFNIVRKNLNDMVPKAIISIMVNKTKSQA